MMLVSLQGYRTECNFDVMVIRHSGRNIWCRTSPTLPASQSKHLIRCSQPLGDTLSKLKVHVVGMDPENKGHAIGNCPELARAHNSHAVPAARYFIEFYLSGKGIVTDSARNIQLSYIYRLSHLLVNFGWLDFENGALPSCLATRPLCQNPVSPS